MLLFDDDDELPETPSEAEVAFAAKLGPDGVAAADVWILAATSKFELKIAMIIARALGSAGLPLDEACADLYARRVLALIAAGKLQARGNPRKPRWSEVRLPTAS